MRISRATEVLQYISEGWTLLDDGSLAQFRLRKGTECHTVRRDTVYRMIDRGTVREVDDRDEKGLRIWPLCYTVPV